MQPVTCPLHTKTRRTLTTLIKISHLVWAGGWTAVAGLLAYATGQYLTGDGVTLAWLQQLVVALVLAECGRLEKRTARRLLGGTRDRIQGCLDCKNA